MTGTHRADIASIDSRLALRTYSVVMGLAGFVLAGWGQVWLGSHLADVPWGRAAIIRMSGAVMIAAAVCAVGLASADPRARRRMFSWFIAAHVVVWLMLVLQSYGTLEIGFLRQSSWALLAVILGLLYVRFPFGVAPRAPLSVTSTPPEHAGEMSTPDEQQIREAAAQEERNRLARELHDAVKQQIFAIQTSAATAETRFDTDPAGAREAIAQVRQSAREAMSEMEAMLEQLRVAPLGNTGLVEAIRKQCDALAFRTGADVDLRVEPLPADEALAPGTHQAIYRVVQEALANVGRHARARRVRVSIETTPVRLAVRVQDDGVGFDREHPAPGMGIHNMRARAAEIGATVEVGGADGTGTIMTLSVPYETADARGYRRRHALKLTVLFAGLTVVGLLSLVENGPALRNVFVVVFALAFVQQLRAWLRLRRGSAGEGVRPAESAS